MLNNMNVDNSMLPWLPSLDWSQEYLAVCAVIHRNSGHVVKQVDVAVLSISTI